MTKTVKDQEVLLDTLQQAIEHGVGLGIAAVVITDMDAVPGGGGLVSLLLPRDHAIDPSAGIDGVEFLEMFSTLVYSAAVSMAGMGPQKAVYGTCFLEGLAAGLDGKGALVRADMEMVRSASASQPGEETRH